MNHASLLSFWLVRILLASSLAEWMVPFASSARPNISRTCLSLWSLSSCASLGDYLVRPVLLLCIGGQSLSLGRAFLLKYVSFTIIVTLFTKFLLMIFSN